MDQEELKNKVKYLEQFLSNDSIKYLYSLLNLEESVFKNEEYNEVLKNIDGFIDIAYYNICFRAAKVLTDKNLNHFLLFNNNILNYDISYKKDKNIYFFNLTKTKDNKCNLTICNKLDVSDYLKRLKEEKEYTYNLKLKVNKYIKYCEIDAKIKYLNDKIYFLEHNGYLLEKLSRDIEYYLLDDYNIKSLDNDTNNKLIRTNSWCDIYSKNIY